MNEENGCTCDIEDIEPHTCPFKEEIDDDFDSDCTCCEYCTNNCAMDI